MLPLLATSALSPPHVVKVRAGQLDALAHARDSLRAVLPAGTRREVHLSAGIHFLSAPLRLDARDSAVYATAPEDAARGRYAHVSGGVRVPASAFTEAEVPSGARGVFVADLLAAGLNATALGGMGTGQYPTAKLELFYGGEPQVLARDPNLGADASRTWQWAGYDKVKVDGLSLLLDDGVRGALWQQALADAPDRALWLHGYWKFDWRDAYVRVASIEREAGFSARFNLTISRDSTPVYPPVSGCRFYALNALRLLDAPGEYFVSASGRLYFFPPGGRVAEDVIVSVHANVLQLRGAHDVSFRDLVLSTSQQDTVVVDESTNVSFVNCTISNSGGSGACLRLGGENNSVRNSTISGCAGAGILVEGGDTLSLRRANSSVVGNVIANFSRLARTYHPGVGFAGVGVYVANNTVSNAPHACMNGGGSYHLFEYNRLEHCVYECIDAGAFYVGRSWAQRGNVVRFNVFDTVRPTERLAQKSCAQNACYLDDQMSGYDFYGNTIINASQGVLLGGGRRNRIHRNRFVACDVDVAFDDRGLTWQSDSCQRNCSASMGTQTTSCFANALDKVNFTQPPYSKAFPEIVDIYDEHPCVPVGNVIEDNFYCHEESPAGKGIFIDQSESVIRSWYSSISNNQEVCP
ncbi:hypothetical protein AB1Y20_021535 [Prymnesium parvum]|uniref:Right handed beta helix domain-containing protein n=1 Tax=Prymnesium parvum TaxID=97485 RepID=A0AB34JK36_PRYPA